jgi:hypothetical protein
MIASEVDMSNHRIQSSARAETRIPLAIGELASLRVAPGQVVEGLRGSIWLTVDNGGRDHILNPGQRLQLAGGGCMVVEGLTASELRLAPSPARQQGAPIVDRKRPGWSDFSIDSMANALVLAVSLFILLFSAASAAVQSGQAPGRGEPFTPTAHEYAVMGTNTFASRLEQGSARCRLAKLC